MCSAGVRRKAFTLIELLVVIAIIAILMVILVPTLRRVRNQGWTVVCRANLRQWGTLIATHINENNGRFQQAVHNASLEYWLLADYGGAGEAAGYEVTEGIRCCPTATKPANPTSEPKQGFDGGTFWAWGLFPPNYFRLPPKHQRSIQGSYGCNGSLGGSDSQESQSEVTGVLWMTSDVRGASNIPVLFDCATLGMGIGDSGDEPPECDAIPTLNARSKWFNPACINRHDGTINVLFLDWSVRKVGLKELWTLKWNRQYNTAGPWTKSGGVESSDWPQWMRKFRDY